MIICTKIDCLFGRIQIKITLASTSPYRKALLERLKLEPHEGLLLRFRQLRLVGHGGEDRLAVIDGSAPGARANKSLAAWGLIAPASLIGSKSMVNRNVTVDAKAIIAPTIAVVFAAVSSTPGKSDTLSFRVTKNPMTSA